MSIHVNSGRYIYMSIYICTVYVCACMCMWIYIYISMRRHMYACGTKACVDTCKFVSSAVHATLLLEAFCPP